MRAAENQAAIFSKGLASLKKWLPRRHLFESMPMLTLINLLAKFGCY